MKKRILSAFFAVCVATGIISLPVAAAESIQVKEEQVESSAKVSGYALSKDWTWRYYEYDNGTVAVCEYCRTSPDGNLVIPEMIDGKKVVQVGRLGEEFVVPDRRMIKNVTIPATVTDIDSGVFRHYSWMTDLTILGDVYSMTDVAEGCTALKTLTLKKDYINMSDFKDSPITTINFVDGMKYMTVQGAGAKLTTVNLPRSVESFSVYDCPNLSTLNCAKSFSQIDLSLQDCPKLHMEVWVKGYYMKDFSNTGITKVTIDVSSWGKYGWLKESLKDCPYLKEIVLTGKNNYYFIKNGMLCWKNKKNSKYYDILAYPAGKSTKGNFMIPKNVKCVYHGAFDSCKFKTITIPENITSEWYWEQNMDNSASSLLRGNQTVLCLVKGSVADREDGNAEELAKYLNVKKMRIRYQLGSTYRISYKLNGGVNAAGNPTSYRAGQIKKLKKPTRKGYVFLGWKRNGSDGYENTTKRHYGTFKDYTFTACWKKDNSSKSENGKSHKIIITKSYKKVLGSKAFKLKARSSIGAKLKYSSSNSKIAKVNARGKVKIIGVGKAVITVTADADGKYTAARTKVTITVIPKTVSSVKVKAQPGRKCKVSWKKAAKVSGYQIRYSTKSSMESSKIAKAAGAKKNSVTLKKLKKRKKYYVQVRAYQRVSGKTYYGNWSKKKSVKI